MPDTHPFDAGVGVDRVEPHRNETHSLLASRVTWWVLGAWLAAFGLSTWMVEAVLLTVVPGAPAETLGGVFRLVQAILWVAPVAIATGVAERWPIENVVAQWKRVLGQLALGVALGPVWGTLAYWLSTFLMPAWLSRGMWGIIATESKGALYGYVITALLAHVVIRAQRQREREVMAANAVREAAEARLRLLKLELQPESVLRAMDAVEDLIDTDIDVANDSLVLLSDALHEIAASARVHEVSLRDELAATEVFVRLYELTQRSGVRFVVDADASVLDAAVPHLLLHPLIEALVRGRPVPDSESTEVQVRAKQVAEQVELQIAANGRNGDRVDRIPAERSVEYTRERLAHLYGDGRFGLTTREETGARYIEVTLPLHSLEERAVMLPHPVG